MRTAAPNRTLRIVQPMVGGRRDARVMLVAMDFAVEPTNSNSLPVVAAGLFDASAQWPQYWNAINGGPLLNALPFTAQSIRS